MHDENPQVVVMWPDPSGHVMMTNEKFEGMRWADGFWSLPFPFFPGRNWAPEAAQLAWAGDILLRLSRAGFQGTVLVPPAFQHH